MIATIMPLPSSLHTGGEYIVLFLFDVANITSSNISISFLLRQQMQTDTNNNTPTNNNNNNTIIIIIYRPSFIVHRLSCVVGRHVQTIDAQLINATQQSTASCSSYQLPCRRRSDTIVAIATAINTTIRCIRKHRAYITAVVDRGRMVSSQQSTS